MTTNEKGQSLIEVLIAVAIATIVVVVLVRITSRSVTNATYARNYSLATKYAQDSIEQARALRELNSAAFFAGTGQCDLTDHPDQAEYFTRARSCTLAVNGTTKTMSIEVTVSWQDNNGTHASKLSTKLTNWK